MLINTRKINRFYNLVKDLLERSSLFDGRWLVALSLVTYFLILFIANFLIPYYEFWQKIGIPAETPSFMDLRGVLAGFECTRLGYDVLLENPCDPWERAIIYPRIWWKLTALGLEQNHTVLLGILLTLIFYVVTLKIIGRLNIYEGIIYALILCSPPIMLLIERGNVDIIMYELTFGAVIMAQSRKLWIRILGYISLLIPTFLKILSFFSLTIILKEKRNIFILWFSSLLTISAIYIYNIKDELAVSKAYFSSSTWYKHGYKILISKFGSVFSPEYILARKLNLIFAFLFIVGIVAIIIIAIKILLAIPKEIKQWHNFNISSMVEDEHNLLNDKLLNLFRVGSSFYLGAFLVTVSFDYKLVFLIFTIPQIIAWIKQDQTLSIPSSFALLGIICTFYLSPFYYVSLLDEVVNWLLWLYFFYAFVLTLPKWIKISFHNLMMTKIIS